MRGAHAREPVELAERPADACEARDRDAQRAQPAGLEGHAVTCVEPRELGEPPRQDGRVCVRVIRRFLGILHLCSRRVVPPSCSSSLSHRTPLSFLSFYYKSQSHVRHRIAMVLLLSHT